MDPEIRGVEIPPRISLMKEGVALLKGTKWDKQSTVGKNQITGFLNRYLFLISKLSSQFDKKRIKTSNPEVI